MVRQTEMGFFRDAAKTFLLAVLGIVFVFATYLGVGCFVASPGSALPGLIIWLIAMILLWRIRKRRVLFGCWISVYILFMLAVGIPSFLPATTRAYTARTQSDMRNLAYAVERYRADHGVYPPAYDADGKVVPANENGISVGYVPYLLSTPVSYVGTIPTAPFHERKRGEPPEYSHTYRYAVNASSCWIMAGAGPDQQGSETIEDFCDPNKADGDPKKFLSNCGGEAVEYDSSNGSTSWGDIMLFSTQAGQWGRM